MLTRTSKQPWPPSPWGHSARVARFVLGAGLTWGCGSSNHTGGESSTGGHDNGNLSGAAGSVVAGRGGEGDASGGGSRSPTGGVQAGGATAAGGGSGVSGTGGSAAGKRGGSSAGGEGNTVGGGGNANAGMGGTTAGAAGGNAGSGAGGTLETGRVRTILHFDGGWAFHYGDASGADGAAFADSGWRQLSVPHDWAIEGPNPPDNPFSSSAATTGRGGYLPSGVAWYRKHFTLGDVPAENKVFIEFDGVMGNSTVYVNGQKIGNHPFGYVSFRYDISAAVKFGAMDNVIAVKTDTTTQPASRYYAGAGIYRHVRLIATSTVHVEQYATFVTTPAPTTTSATVHVTTTVSNAGSASASASIEGVVSDPSGTALAPVTTAAQNIAPGSSADFTFDVAVDKPKLWDLANPNMYGLLTKVNVGGAVVDDDVTSFGIRELKFDGGMTLNGKSVKFQGVCLHQDYHALGLAAPQRAMQRRLAQLKSYGVNAVRTAHDPPSPDFLELTDRMGMLVLDEFTDVWVSHKYSDVGDYSAYFNKAATAPTGMPLVPEVAGVTNAGATWWQVDFTGWITRDRNHPSVALYSVGNEIRDSLSTRTPILTKMVAMSHALDPSRSDTQALFQPDTNGDIGSATNDLLDVWGDNYHVDSALTAMVNAPTKSGLLTEIGTETSTWATVKSNAALTGLFMWTGVDYLGEADAAWPTVGSTAGILDEMGTPKSLAFSWQSTWSAPKTTFSTGATAGKVVLTADHSTITTDWNDVAYVRAAVPDATAAVTFEVDGPGTLVAVDSASMTQETFRGNTRNASGNLAYAVVRATGPGSITVTAQSPGLSDGSVAVEATAGSFVPCSGTCD